MGVGLLVGGRETERPGGGGGLDAEGVEFGVECYYYFLLLVRIMRGIERGNLPARATSSNAHPAS